MTTELIKVDHTQYGLTETKAQEVAGMFSPMLSKMEALESEYNEIISENEITPELCARAKELRLRYVKTRTGTDQIHKDLKQFYLQGGRFIDGWKNAQRMAAGTKEDALRKIETHFERIEAERIQKLNEERREQLRTVDYDGEEMNFGKLTEETFKILFSGAKNKRDKRIAEEKARKEAEEKARIQCEKEEAEKREQERLERERIQKENERLKKEKAEAEKKADEERKIAEAKAEKLRKEKLAIEKKRKAEAEKARKKAEEVERQRRLEAEKARKAQQELESRKKAEVDARIKAEKEAYEKARREQLKGHNEIVEDLKSDLYALIKKYRQRLSSEGDEELFNDLYQHLQLCYTQIDKINKRK